MKKILAIISMTLISVGLLSMLSAPAMAGELIDADFNVKDILKLPTEGATDYQPTAYFDDEPNSPIVSLILTILNYAIAIMGSIGVILLIVAGFQMMIAEGDQQKLDEAKETVKYVVIGLIAALLSYIIVIFVQSLFITK